METISQAEEFFKLDHPQEYDQLLYGINRGSNFYQSLRHFLNSKGDLTERQLAAIRNDMNRRAEQEYEKQGPNTVLSLESVFEKFEAAQASGLKRPKLRLEGVCFTLAKGRNAGYLYVKAGPDYDDTYLGKVAPDGVFTRSRDCDNETVKHLQKISENVLEAAQAYGQVTGACSCCGRTLTDPKSVEMGIGPICATKWEL